jgi:hypothetical protein
VLWLPSTAVGDGETEAGGRDAEPDGEELGEGDEEPGAEGELAALGDGGDDGAPDEAAEDVGDAAGDCETTRVAPGDAVTGTSEGVDVA